MLLPITSKDLQATCCSGTPPALLCVRVGASAHGALSLGLSCGSIPPRAGVTAALLLMPLLSPYLKAPWFRCCCLLDLPASRRPWGLPQSSQDPDTEGGSEAPPTPLRTEPPLWLICAPSPPFSGWAPPRRLLNSSPAGTPGGHSCPPLYPDWPYARGKPHADPGGEPSCIVNVGNTRLQNLFLPLSSPWYI